MINYFNRFERKILILLWSFPFVALLLFFLSIRMPLTQHSTLLLNSVYLVFSFTTIVSFFYRISKVIGLSIFIGIILIIVLGSISVLSKSVFLLIVAILFFFEFIYLKKIIIKNILTQFLLSLFTIFFTLIPFFNLIYSQIDSESRLVNSTLINDTLFHSAIAAMWKNYHVVSHGMHGLDTLSYHFGSHLFMAGVSSLTNLTAFQTYTHFFAMFMIPLLAIVIISVSEEFLPSKSNIDFFSKLLIYSVVFLGTGVLVKESFLYSFAIWPSFYESESYTFSLILLFCFFSILKTNKISSLYLRALVVILISCSIFVSKISTGVCALSILGSWALFSKEKMLSKEWLFRWVTFSISFFSCLLLSIVIHKRAENNYQSFEFLAFIKTYILIPFPLLVRYIFFIFIHFIFPMIVFITYMLSLKLPEIKLGFPTWWFSGLFLTFLIGLAAVSFLKLIGGAEYYFSNVAMFVSLPFILNIYQIGKHRIKIHFQVIILIGIMAMSIYYAPKIVINGIVNFSKQINRTPEGSILSDYIMHLVAIRENQHTKDALIYIPRSEYGFWGGNNQCKNIHHAISAISERPAIFGWPRGGDDCYGFMCGNRFHSEGLCEKSQLLYNDSELIMYAHSLGFRKVIKVTLEEIKTIY